MKILKLARANKARRSTPASRRSAAATGPERGFRHRTGSPVRRDPPVIRILRSRGRCRADRVDSDSEKSRSPVTTPLAVVNVGGRVAPGLPLGTSASPLSYRQQRSFWRSAPKPQSRKAVERFLYRPFRHLGLKRSPTMGIDCGGMERKPVEPQGREQLADDEVGTGTGTPLPCRA